MATVPHTPASCEPLTTLVTELFGDLPTPASPLPASDRTTCERWHAAVTQVGEQLRAKLHVKVLPDRLHKALALVPAHAEAPPPVTLPASPEDAHQERLPSADRWDVNEAPASGCLRLRVGELEILYTMRDVTDAELTSRVQHLVPWVQDLLDQARERQALLDTLRQQREAASAGQTAVPQPPPSTPPADLQALIQQTVQQALAAQQLPSNGQPPANSTAPAATPPASPADWCPLHQVPMEQRSNAKGAWYSHWVASEQRYCKGK